MSKQDRFERPKPIGLNGIYADTTLYSVGERQVDRFGNTYRFLRYSPSETSVTKRKGMPVGWDTYSGGGATRDVTADFSASKQSDFVGLLCAVPTSTKPYVWVLETADNILNTAVGPLTLTTDGQVATGDPIGWVDDDLIGSNHLCGGSVKKKVHRDSWDMGTAIVQDSSTTLARASITKASRSQLPDPAKVAFFVQDQLNPAAGLFCTGDTGFSLTNLLAAGVPRKARATGDTTDEDEYTATTPVAEFTYANGKRVSIRGKITVTDTGGECGFVFGFLKAVATGSVNMVTDAGAAIGTAAVMHGNGFYKLGADMKLHHHHSDGTTLDTNDAEDLATLVSGTEVSLLQRGTAAASGSIESFVNGAAAGTALTWGAATISGAIAMFGGVYQKQVTAAAAELDFRDVEIAIEL